MAKNNFVAEMTFKGLLKSQRLADNWKFIKTKKAKSCSS